LPIRISPFRVGLNAVLSRSSSCSTPVTPSTVATLERIIRASRTSDRSLSCTEITNGDWNVFCRVPSPPTTVMFLRKVTGSSNVVETLVKVSSSSALSTS